MYIRYKEPKGPPARPEDSFKVNFAKVEEVPSNPSVDIPWNKTATNWTIFLGSLGASIALFFFSQLTLAIIACLSFLPVLVGILGYKEIVKGDSRAATCLWAFMIPIIVLFSGLIIQGDLTTPTTRNHYDKEADARESLQSAIKASQNGNEEEARAIIESAAKRLDENK